MVNTIDWRNDLVLWNYWVDRLRYRWEEPHWTGPHLVNMISDSCGWLPLEVGAAMTVGFDDGSQYEIKRIKDRF